MGLFDKLKDIKEGLSAVMNETKAEEEMNCTMYELSIIDLDSNIKEKVETFLIEYSVHHYMKMNSTTMKGKVYDEYNKVKNAQLDKCENLAFDALKSVETSNKIPETLKNKCREVLEKNIKANERTKTATDKYQGRK